MFPKRDNYTFFLPRGSQLCRRHWFQEARLAVGFQILVQHRINHALREKMSHGQWQIKTYCIGSIWSHTSCPPLTVDSRTTSIFWNLFWPLCFSVWFAFIFHKNTQQGWFLPNSLTTGVASQIFIHLWLVLMICNVRLSFEPCWGLWLAPPALRGSKASSTRCSLDLFSHKELSPAVL